MSADLKRRIRRVVADQAAEPGADTVSGETLDALLTVNAGAESAEIERALDELVAEGTLTESDGRYGLADE